MIASPPREARERNTSGTWLADSTDIASLVAAKASLMAFLRARGTADASAYDDCALAVGELLANAARHAHPGPIELTLEWSDARPRLAVTNAGDPFPLKIERPPVERESGRGLYIIAQVLDVPRVDAVNGHCTVSIVLPVDKA